MKVPADQLQRVLGITDVNYLVSGRSLAVIDSPLGDSDPSSAGSGGSTGGRWPNSCADRQGAGRQQVKPRKKIGTTKETEP